MDTSIEVANSATESYAHHFSDYVLNAKYVPTMNPDAPSNRNAG